MKPDPKLILENYSAWLAERIVPQLSGFDANSVAMISAMLKITSEEWDRAAARRIEENAAIRALFAQSQGVVTDAALATELAAMAAEQESDYRVSALHAANERLRWALIRLQAHVEDLAGTAARSLEKAIWAELRISVERREISLANF